MKIMSSGGETVEVPKEYEEVVRKNINNPDYINSLVQGFKSGGSWKPNKKPYKYSERARINEVTQMTYGGMNDHLSVYPMAMQKGGVSDPYFPNSDGQFTNDRLSNFINMVQGSAQKAMVKELAKQGMESGILPPGMMAQNGKSMTPSYPPHVLNLIRKYNPNWKPQTSNNSDPGFFKGPDNLNSNVDLDPGFSRGTSDSARVNAEFNNILNDRGNGMQSMVNYFPAKAPDLYEALYNHMTQAKQKPNGRQSGGSTPYQNGLTAGTGWLARHGGSHLPKAQYAGAFGTLLPPLNFTPGKIIQGTYNYDELKRREKELEKNQGVSQQGTVAITTGNNANQYNFSASAPEDAVSQSIVSPDFQKDGPGSIERQGDLKENVTPKNQTMFSGYRAKPRLSGQQKAMLMNTGMETVTNFANRIDEAKKEEQLRQKRTADYLFDPTQGNRGDYTANYGYFRPDQMVPVQYRGAAGSYAQYGGSQDDGVYMSEDEIQQILANGGEIEYLD